jgi:hypothetical protein
MATLLALPPGRITWHLLVRWFRFTPRTGYLPTNLRLETGRWQGWDSKCFQKEASLIPFLFSLIPALPSLRQLPQQILIELNTRFKIRDREVFIGGVSLTVGQGESE